MQSTEESPTLCLVKLSNQAVICSAYHYVCGLDLLLLALGAPHRLLDLDAPPTRIKAN